MEQLEKVIDANDGYEQTAQRVGKGIKCDYLLNKKYVYYDKQYVQPAYMENNPFGLCALDKFSEHIHIEEEFKGGKEIV